MLMLMSSDFSAVLQLTQDGRLNASLGRYVDADTDDIL